MRHKNKIKLKKEFLTFRNLIKRQKPQFLFLLVYTIELLLKFVVDVEECVVFVKQGT